MIAVIDSSGTVYEAVQRACPGFGLRRLAHRLPTNGSRPALAVFAIYGPADWKRLPKCASAMLTVAMTATGEDPADAPRARAAGAFGLLHIGMPASALRRAVAGALN